MAGFAQVGYRPVHEGMCSSADMERMNSQLECAAGATALRWYSTFPSTTSSASYPPGCFAVSYGTGLRFHTNPSKSTKSCGGSKPCLCTAFVPKCPFSDGSTANKGPCVCGNTTVCTLVGSTGGGLHCHQETEECRRFPICSIVDASAKNTAACTCGNADCDAGSFCWSKFSECNTDGKFSTYSWITEGVCPDLGQGWTAIDSEVKCSIAASVMGVWKDIPLTDRSVKPPISAYPAEAGKVSGCFRSWWHGLPSFRPSYAEEPSVCHQEFQGDFFSNKCLCAFRASPCEIVDGSAPNTATTCWCGPKGLRGLCSEETNGRYCDQSTGSCHRFLPCEDHFGDNENSQPGCGTFF
jgi:hypothetical protein